MSSKHKHSLETYPSWVDLRIILRRGEVGRRGSAADTASSTGRAVRRSSSLSRSAMIRQCCFSECQDRPGRTPLLSSLCQTRAAGAGLVH